MNNFERIASFLRSEGTPKTPQQISDGTEIDLSCVYHILRSNKEFFSEILDDERLIGWVIKNSFFVI